MKTIKFISNLELELDVGVLRLVGVLEFGVEEESFKNAFAPQIVAKENHFTLEMPACSAEDSGQYTCRVSDAAGTANVTCSAQLEVHQRESISLPYRL